MPPDSSPERSTADRLLLVIGSVSGATVALWRMASSTDPAGVSWMMVLLQTAVAAQGGAAVLWVVRASLRWLVGRTTRSHAAQQRYQRGDTSTYAVFLLTLSTAVGVQLVPPVAWTIIALFVAAQLVVLRSALPARSSVAAPSGTVAISTLFFLSGVAALVYQVTWHRSLYRIFGVSVEAVTVIVSVFMLGLGLGALAGGALSRRAPRQLGATFVALELGVGLFGVISNPLMARLGAVTVAASLPRMTLAVYAVLAVPTLLMGATLPVLVAWLDTAWRDAGRSMARLYFVNTLGSAVACFLTVDVLFAFTGLRGATLVAATINLMVAVMAVLVFRRVGTPTSEGRDA